MTIDIDRGEPSAPAVTMVELLRQRATTGPDHIAYIFQDDRSTVQICYGELDRRAQSIAGWLQQGVDTPGPVLICCPSGLDYIAALFGCFYAGFPAIPSSPPESGRAHRTLARLQATIRNAEPVIALTTEAVLAAAADVLEQTPELQPLRWQTIEQIDAQPEHVWHEPELTGDTLAMLMYTSGSTGTPKGVMISHGNMLHNVTAFPGFEARPCGTIVSWLPLYHDLGLFLGVVHPLYRGVPAVLMSPTDFVRRPLSWLEAMSRYGATTTGAPNFAYDLCVRKITPEQRAQLDLSAWNMALNGAEPVRPDVLDRFTQTFASCGFRPESFYPSYGMSDATATVSGATTFAPPVKLAADREALKHRMLMPSQDSTARILVGCGQPLADQQLAIVDPDTLQPCAENQIGEIWLSGASVAQGYWKQPETTERIFHAALAGTTGPRFFRTGDLGLLHAGELFLVGRLNDLLIIRGQNFYPEDIEVTVGQSHGALPNGGGAVFAVEVMDEEHVVVVHEVERPELAGDEVMGRIRESVAEAHGIQVHAVALIRKGSLPRTSSGKIARKACRAAFVEQRLDLLTAWSSGHEATSQDASKNAITRAEQKPSAHAIADWLVGQLATLLKLPPADIDLRAPFKRHGLDSIQTLALTAELEAWLGGQINQTLLWSYPSIAALSEYLAADQDHSQHTSTLAAHSADRLSHDGSMFGQHEPVAIIGMGCRFPGAGNPASFWQMLCNGVDAITEVPAERWDIESLYHPDRSVPGKMYSRWGGFLDNLHSVDARFMGISPREAALLDPQQRLLFEVAWEALEDAGQVPTDLSGSRTGVFVGALGFDYLRIIQTSLELIDAYTGTGAAHSILANRLSYMLNLCGPSITVDTACSGSLVAIHLACQSLRSGESELALAGGVNVNLLPDGNVFFSKAGALSPDGRCKPFSAEANGIVRSDGAGVVVLKLLRQAILDNDPIYAVIRGSAVNQDGRTNGIMAPSAQSQEAVLRAAYRQSQVQPDQIQYIETHGTGTSLGDMIEAQALGAVLADNRPANRPCHIGSVKSNIGHTEAAAGMASVIKVALALKHGVIPPSLHCQSPNPQIAFDAMRLQVQQALAPWPSGDGPRLAGVSGFGFGGTNAHVVLEGFAEITPQPAPTLERPLVLPLSAHTDEALRQLAQDYRSLLTAHEEQSLQNLCYTASVRRTHHAYRLAAVGQTGAEIAELLAAFLHNESSSSLASGKKPAYPQKLVWVFSGQGSHWAGMGRALLEREPIFAAALRRCDTLFQQHAGWSLEAALSDETRLNETDVAQPMIFAVQVALAALWRSWGIAPDMIVGHSLGEVAAAHVAGALSLEDAVQIVYHRSRLMKRVAGLGKTAAVELTLEQAQLMLIGREDLLAVAGSNSPTSCILSGDPTELSRVLASLERQNIFCRMLRGVDIAFHSAQMDPLKAELVAALAHIQPQPTGTPLISTVTGSVIDGTALNATYWGRNLREPFLFAEAVRELLQQEYTTFLEVSPHPVLAESILRSGKHFNYPVTVIASLRRNRDDSQSLLEALGSLYTLGAPIAWREVAGEGHCVPLPQYPWQRERYWLDQLLPERAEGYSFDSLIARLGAKTAAAHSQTRRADAHPLLDSYLRASITGQHFWESALSTTLVPYLRDHQVQGLTVLPGSAYIEMGLVAAAALGNSYRLCDVEFKQALFVPQTETCNIQMAVSPGPDGRSRFQIASTRPSEHGPTNWIANASGALEPTARNLAPSNPNDTPQQIQARCTELITDAEHYQTMQSYKLMYGPQFRAITGIWRRDGEALGQLCLPAETAHESASYALHPVLLDAAFQVVAATLPRVDRSDDTFLPQGMRSFKLYTKATTRIWCHALLRSSLEEDVDRHEADLWLLDENGQVVAEVQGLQLQRLGAATPHDSLARLDEWLYTIDWQPLSAAPSTIAGGSWLIFADDGGVGQQLAEVLRAHGVETLLVYRDHGLAQRHNQWGIDPSSREDWLALAQAVAGRSQSPYENIVYLWALDATPSDQLTLDGLQADQSLCFGNIVRLVQSLMQVEREQAPRLWLITVGSQAIDAAHNPLGITQAPVWGLGRVLMQEHPELRTTLIDLDPTLPGMSVSTLLEALAQADAEDQIGYRQGQRYVARLAADATSPATQPLRWRTDGSYLITGGLGGLGLEVARWMAQQGARRLILLGRTPLPPRVSWHQYNSDSRAGQVISAVRQLEAMGVAVHVVALDISDAAQLSAYLDTYRREGWPPIRGVVHAAGVLHDQLLAHTDESAIIDVLQPKITGTWLLHHLLQDQPLDFFVLFSSLASALGSVGQSSYAAGNAFMDALAHYRHTLGQPAISINWGPWADVGMAARSGVNTHMTEQGIRPLLATQGTAVLHHLMQSAAAQTTALVIDWSRWFRANPSARSKPILANLLATVLPDSEATRGTAATWAQELAQAAVETQQTLLEEHLLTLTANVLRVQRDRLPFDQPLHIFGIDSIMSIELRNSIEATTQIQLPVAYLLEGPSITKMAAEILSQLRSMWVQDLLTSSEEPAIEDHQALALLQTQIDQEHDDRIAHLLDQLEHLSAEEVAVLLKDM